jgi:asparagine synthase (glutamine-hydrolysing)
MCGIAGIYNFGSRQAVDPIVLQRMTDIIAHRGPDDEGHFIKGHIGLGHRRLSIIDLSRAGRQPMENGTGDIWITYNGECYNYQSFREILEARGYKFRSQSDTEILLCLYEEYGTEFLQMIEGMYALAIWDARHERLVLARDPIGIKPLFYYHDGSRLVFASELKALLADPQIQCQIDYSALTSFLQLMSIPDPETIFRGIRKLLPGHYLVVEAGRVSTHEYWDIRDVMPDENASIEESALAFDDVFRQAIKSHMIADVPVGAFLSGGVDSSTVVAIAAREAEIPLQTFAISFDLAEFDESPHAARVAALLGTEHQRFEMTPDLVRALPRIVWHADEPSGISSSLGVYFLAQAARRHLKVVLTGDGGDEVFGGYPWRHRKSHLGWYRIAARVAHRLAGPWLGGLTNGVTRRRIRRELTTASASPGAAYELLQSLYMPDELSELLTPDVWEVARVENREAIRKYYETLGGAGDLNRKLYADIKTTLVSEMLTKVDRMTMAFGLEARVPFLDRRLVEWAFKIPDTHKVHAGEGKYVVKRAMERILPADILYRQKHGFNLPLRRWMTEDLAQFVSDTLLSARFRQRQLVKPEIAASLVARLQSKAENSSNQMSNQVFELLALELWFQQYVDKRHEFAKATV